MEDLNSLINSSHVLQLSYFEISFEFFDHINFPTYFLFLAVKVLFYLFALFMY